MNSTAQRLDIIKHVRGREKARRQMSEIEKKIKEVRWGYRKGGTSTLHGGLMRLGKKAREHERILHYSPYALKRVMPYESWHNVNTRVKNAFEKEGAALRLRGMIRRKIPQLKAGFWAKGLLKEQERARANFAANTGIHPGGKSSPVHKNVRPSARSMANAAAATLRNMSAKIARNEATLANEANRVARVLAHERTGTHGRKPPMRNNNANANTWWFNRAENKVVKFSNDAIHRMASRLTEKNWTGLLHAAHRSALLIQARRILKIPHSVKDEDAIQMAKRIIRRINNY